MKYNDLVKVEGLKISSKIDDEYIYNKAYIAKFKSIEYIKKNHFWNEEMGVCFIDEDEYDDYENGRYEDDREVMFADDSNKIVICHYIMSRDGRPVFGIYSVYQSVSTWCVDIIGDEESHPEYFI